MIDVPKDRQFADERGRLWVQCDCGKWIRVFKPFLGSLHFCGAS